MMNMLKERSRNIQFEAFHVFKVQLFLSLNILIVKQDDLLSLNVTGFNEF